jgi:hypothetical protein
VVLCFAFRAEGEIQIWEVLSQLYLDRMEGPLNLGIPCTNGSLPTTKLWEDNDNPDTP